jgi:hypothetical protein
LFKLGFFRAKKKSLGRELNPRPLPYQGNALARLSYQGVLLIKNMNII